MKYLHSNIEIHELILSIITTCFISYEAVTVVKKDNVIELSVNTADICANLNFHNDMLIGHISYKGFPRGVYLEYYQLKALEHRIKTQGIIKLISED